MDLALDRFGRIYVAQGTDVLGDDAGPGSSASPPARERPYQPGAAGSLNGTFRGRRAATPAWHFWQSGPWAGSP